MSDAALFYLARSQHQLLPGGLESEVLRRQLVVPSPGLDAPLLASRWAAAVERHDALRLAFVKPAGLTGLLQTAEGREMATHAAAGLAETEAAEWAAPMALGEGGLVRAALAEGHLVLTAAATAADAPTLRLLAAELVSGTPAEEDPLPFVDFGSWEGEQLEGDSADARVARAYWRGLVGEETEAAGDTHAATATGAMSSIDVPGSLTSGQWLAALAVVARQQQSRPGDELAATILAVSVPGRTDAELENALGPYARYVPTVVSDDGQVDLTVLTGRLEADVAAGARFATFAPDPVTTTAFSVRQEGERPAVGRFPLELVVRDDSATLWYDAAVLGDAEAGWLCDRLARAASATTGQPSTPIDDLDLLGDAERAFLDSALVGEGVQPPLASVPDAIAHHARQTPDAPAVVMGEVSLSYADLDRAARRMAVALGPGGAPVAILLDRSADAVVAAVGVMRAGRPYVALEPAHPDERLATQLAAGGIETVVTTPALAARLPAGTRVVSPTDPTDPTDATEPTGDAQLSSVPGDRLAYLLFTSGSTGVPKPVAVTQANVVSYVAGVSARLGLGASSRMATVTGLSTDLGNTSVFGALVNGGVLEVVPEEAVTSGARLGDLIRAHGVTALKITPSHLRALLSAGDVRLDLPLLICGGEPLDLALVRQAQQAGARRVVNHYGPTETTVGVLAHEVTDDDNTPLPLGRPLPHVCARIVDASGRPVPVGVRGELEISGPGVAAGYVGDQSGSGFGTGPTGEARYRTGDVVRLRSDGEVLFEGRADGQVKVRGFRVDLGEVETRLRAEQPVTDAAAVVVDDAIRAFVVTSGAPLDAAATLVRLGRQLPAHMVPLSVHAVADLPRTPSGKVDRIALAAAAASGPPDQATSDGRQPGTPTEEQLLAIWREVLPGAVSGVDDNFFQVGGHSLMATKVIARARAAFAVDLPLHVIFASPTVAAMAAEIDLRRAPEDELDALLGDLDGLSEEEVARLLDPTTSPHDDA